MDKQIAYAYPTPIGRFKVEEAGEVNRELRRIILEREQAEPSQSYSNAGGWHSRQDLLEWPSPAIGALRGWIVEAVNHMVSSTIEMMRATTGNRPTRGVLHLKAWANVCRRGHYHRIHNHPGSAWSGVYYVDAGSEAPGHPLSGILELCDPRPFTEMVATPGDPFGQRAVISPEAGTMVVFPSWLYHFVNPYFGEGERISVAFNAPALEGIPPGAAGVQPRPGAQRSAPPQAGSAELHTNEA